MKSIKKLFRPSSVPNDSVTVKNINNDDIKLKSSLKMSKQNVALNKSMWSSVKSIDDEDDNDDIVEDLQEIKKYAHKDKRRSSVVVSQKVACHRRNSTLSNSSLSESLSDSYSDNEENEGKKKLNPREVYENKDTRKVNSLGFNDFCVSKISQAALGRREIVIAQQEMKGFLSLLKLFEDEKPLKGAKIAGCTHITSQTAVLIEGLIKLGASVRWCSCNIFSTQNEVAAALAEAGVSVFAWKGESEEDFWWAIDQCINPAHGPLDLMLDEGGDLTQRCFIPDSTIMTSCKGIVEESITGVHRLYQIFKKNKVSFPAMNISESIMKSKFDNYYLCKETIVDALKRSTDTMICGKLVLVIGYGSVGKGCCQALRGMSAQVVVAEIDPICAIQACMEGYRVALTADYLSLADIIVTCTGSTALLGVLEFQKLKDGCIVCNMGHASSEIDLSSLETKGVVWERLRDDLDSLSFPSKKSILLIAQGRQANLNCSTVPSIIFSMSSAVQLLALIELFTAPNGRYKNEIYLLPKKYDELIAKHHLSIFGAQLNELTDKQAKSIGVNMAGPFKSNYYRY